MPLRQPPKLKNKPKEGGLTSHVIQRHHPLIAVKNERIDKLLVVKISRDGPGRNPRIPPTEQPDRQVVTIRSHKRQIK